MDVHEYQAKELLSSFGVPVPKGAVAFSPDQAVYAATELGGWNWAVKAQIHAGARGKAGGIKLCKTYHEVRDAAQNLLGKRLVTIQTGPEGKPVQRVYIEVAEPFDRELYLGYVLDRKAERIRVIASQRGGMEIEEIAKNEPEMILQVVVEPAVGLQAFQARELAFQLGLSIKQAQSAVSTIMNAYRAFRDCDATMLEINPLVVAKDDRVLALDAKMSFDDNALFRRHNVADMHDPSQQDPREAQAAELARALASVRRFDDGRITVVHLTRGDFGETGAIESDSEGVVDHLRSVEQTKVAVLIRELLDKEGRKISLRSTDGEVDVSVIARSLGGGGPGKQPEPRPNPARAADRPDPRRRNRAAAAPPGPDNGQVTLRHLAGASRVDDHLRPRPLRRVGGRHRVGRGHHHRGDGQRRQRLPEPHKRRLLGVRHDDGVRR